MGEEYLRRIKSFVLRQGRMTAGQQLAYDSLWLKYGIGSKLGEELNKGQDQNLSLLDFQSVFNNANPVNLEIGFGMGDSLIEMASSSPHVNFLGIEVHTPGVGRILQRIEQKQLNNLRIFHADALNILEYCIPVCSLNAVYLYFPDPWHKRRHNKRRIVSDHFIQLVYSRLQEGGLFHMATDWQDYAKHMLKELAQTIKETPAIKLINQSPNNDYIVRPKWRPETKFEAKGLRKGHGIWDILYKKVAS
ncbi:MAG: tRNA (guanosine(46)-N7)-methyltransferase TrmB [Pseudomonadota bacterium]